MIRFSETLAVCRTGRVRKQVTHAIFSAFLCVSGFAQRVDVFGEAQFTHLQLSCHAVGTNVTGNFEGNGKNSAESKAIEERVNSCAGARSILVDSVAFDLQRRPFHEVAVWRLLNSRAFFFVSGMTIDADGAPNAYNPDDSGLDELANAGAPTRWNGIITDRDGNPLIQQGGDPFPGYYISCTSLSDKTKKFTDPTGYVNASEIPYVALPQDVADREGARLGDFAMVMNLRNGKASFAIYADVGTLGEGSVALAEALGIWSDARRGGESDGILYLLFPGSGNLRPRAIDEIQSAGEKLLLYHSSGLKGFSSCIESDLLRPEEESGKAFGVPQNERDWNVALISDKHSLTCGPTGVNK